MVRGQIMGLAIPEPLGESERQYNDALIQAADIAEARERELLAEHEKWKADFNLVYKLLENDIIKLNSKHEAMIAELQKLTPWKSVSGGQIEAIISKYKVNE